jgi:hypothetical protein
MIEFEVNCTTTNSQVNGHELHLVKVIEGKLDSLITRLAEIVPGHYLAPDRIAAIFRRHGKDALAQRITNLLPDQKSSRSGDIGEIFATEYITEKLEFDVPIKRFRWKDHRQMAMRGDDVIGIKVEEDANIRPKYLKVEAKSRASLSQAIVDQARVALDSEDGLPTAHALGFLAERLFETGNLDLSDRIYEDYLERGITQAQVKNLVFTFSDNAPDNFLTNDLTNYKKAMSQYAVGFRLVGHQNFILSVYEQVYQNHG